MVNQHSPSAYLSFGIDDHLLMPQDFDEVELHDNYHDVDCLQLRSGHALDYLDGSQQYNDELDFNGDPSMVHSSLRAVDTAMWCESLFYSDASGNNEEVNRQRQQLPLSRLEDIVLYNQSTTTWDHGSSSTAMSSQSPSDPPAQISRINDTGDDKSEDSEGGGNDGNDSLMNSIEGGNDGSDSVMNSIEGGNDGNDSLINSIEAKQRRSRQLNTAASARFRKKRKQREEDLTNNLNEMTIKFTAMKDSVTRLTTENDLLRDLLLKNEGGMGLSGNRMRKKKSSPRRMSKK